MDRGEQGAKQEINNKAERHLSAARSVLQARSIQLARMGCVVFHYDMIGYADSRQISYDLAHRFAKQRPDMNSSDAWGLFSPQAESHLQSVMGLQTYNSIRALDFLSQLEDVDAKRLAVTGASGGGTQTFILSAVDPRPVVAFPAVMVSTAMQGGCTCENASLLRVGAGNVEFAALFAPKPLGVTAANDWTKEMSTKGFPELRKIYSLFGAEDKVMLLSRIDFGHNYNLVGRSAMYKWFNQHLELGHKAPIVERDFPFLKPDELTVFDDKHPRPDGGPNFERRLLAHWHKDAMSQIPRSLKGRVGLKAYRAVVGNGIDAVIGRNLPETASIAFEQMLKDEGDGHLRISGLLRYEKMKEELPITFLYPKEWNKRVVIWLSEEGKNGLFDAQGKLRASIQKLVDDGNTIVGVDLFQQGEFLSAGQSFTKTRRVKNTREAAGYTFGYNRTVAARRVHDVLSVIAYVRDHEYTPDRVTLAALDATGPIAIAARAQARDAVHRLAANTKGFRFAKVRDIHSPDFLPGGAKYDDLPGMLAVAAPEATWIAGEAIPRAAKSAYDAISAADRLTAFQGKPTQLEKSALAWIRDKASKSD